MMFMQDMMKEAVRKAVYYRLGYCELDDRTLKSIAYGNLSVLDIDEYIFLIDTFYEFMRENGEFITGYRYKGRYYNIKDRSEDEWNSICNAF